MNTKSAEKLEQWEIGRLKPFENNARTHSVGQVDELARSISEFGFTNPVLAKADGTIIAGHGRVLAAKELGIENVPVLVLDHLTEEQARAYVIADNRLAMNAGWDDELLGVEVDALRDLGFDVSLLGFSEDELRDLGEAPELGDPDEVPEAEDGPATTQPGQVWILGEHRLMCGDSTSAEDVETLTGGAKCGLCFTSPPYGQQRDYTEESDCSDWDDLMRGVFGNLPMTDDGQVLVNLGLIHRDGEWIPYWDEWIEWMRQDQDWRRFGWYVWDQGTGLHGDWNGRLAPCFEFVWHFNRQAVKANKTRECATAGRVNTNAGLREKSGGRARVTTVVQPFAVDDAIARVQRETSPIGDHPAAFPPGLPRHFLQSWPGTIYEPFSGSGTTIIAAEQLGRKCFAMEISPQYCDVAVARWEKFTGGEAVLDGG